MIRLAKPNVLITEETVSNAPKTYHFVFTDNWHCYNHDRKRKGQGQAQIRGLENTISIFTKEKYVYMESRNVVPAPYNKDYKELALFQAHNKPQLKNIRLISDVVGDNVILPRQLGGNLAYMPKSCATWLCNKLNMLLQYRAYKVCTSPKGSYIKAVEDCL
jgi:hypothetical protein